MSIGKRDMRGAALHATQQVLEGNWQVAATAASGANSFTVALRSNPTIAPNLGASDRQRFIGSRIVFTSNKCNGFSSTIADAATASGVTTITLSEELPDALALGDALSIYYVPDGTPASVSTSGNQTTVGTAAVRIDTGLTGRKWIVIFNNGGDTIYIGGSSGVTTAGGMPIPAGGPASFVLGPYQQIWAISGTAGQDVRTWEAA